jgi:hypothetical protein
MQVADVIAEGKEVAQVLTEAYDVVKESTEDLLQAGQEKGEEMMEKGKGINLPIFVTLIVSHFMNTFDTK